MPYKILIVEDDPFTQHFYSYLFKRADYGIIITENGEEIFDILKKEEVSLIILDINLKNTFLDGKRVDGLHISKEIKKKSEFSSIPVLLITAYQKKSGSVNYFEESLADDYIIKPITDFNLLLRKVSKLIKHE